MIPLFRWTGCHQLLIFNDTGINIYTNAFKWHVKTQIYTCVKFHSNCTIPSWLIKAWTTYTDGLGSFFRVDISRWENAFDFTDQVKKHSYNNAIDMKFRMQLCHINSHPSLYFWVITWNNDVVKRSFVENESTS